MLCIKQKAELVQLILILCRYTVLLKTISKTLQENSLCYCSDGIWQLKEKNSIMIITGVNVDMHLDT